MNTRATFSCIFFFVVLTVFSTTAQPVQPVFYTSTGCQGTSFPVSIRAGEIVDQCHAGVKSIRVPAGKTLALYTQCRASHAVPPVMENANPEFQQFIIAPPSFDRCFNIHESLINSNGDIVPETSAVRLSVGVHNMTHVCREYAEHVSRFCCQSDDKCNDDCNTALSAAESMVRNCGNQTLPHFHHIVYRGDSMSNKIISDDGKILKIRNGMLSRRAEAQNKDEPCSNATQGGSNPRQRRGRGGATQQGSAHQGSAQQGSAQQSPTQQRSRNPSSTPNPSHTPQTFSIYVVKIRGENVDDCEEDTIGVVAGIFCLMVPVLLISCMVTLCCLCCRRNGNNSVTQVTPVDASIISTVMSAPPTSTTVVLVTPVTPKKGQPQDAVSAIPVISPKEVQSTKETQTESDYALALQLSRQPN